LRIWTQLAPLHVLLLFLGVCDLVLSSCPSWSCCLLQALCARSCWTQHSPLRSKPAVPLCLWS